MKKQIVILFGGLLVFSLGMTFEKIIDLIKNPPIEKEVPYSIVEIIDGDTLVVNGGMVVRLLGIDAAEMGAREPLEKERALAAKRFLEEKYLGKRIRLEIEKGNEKDKYDRWLAYVWVGTEMINQQLLEKGLVDCIGDYFLAGLKYEDLFRQICLEAVN